MIDNVLNEIISDEIYCTDFIEIQKKNFKSKRLQEKKAILTTTRSKISSKIDEDLGDPLKHEMIKREESLKRKNNIGELKKKELTQQESSSVISAGTCGKRQCCILNRGH